MLVDMEKRLKTLKKEKKYLKSENTILKLSYDWNKQSGTNTEDADDNLLSAIVATQF